MGIADSAGNLANTLASMAHTRLSLAALEVEEASQRFLRQLLLSLVALLLVGIAVVLAAFLVILLFWDTHRVLAVLATMGVLLGTAALIAFNVRRELRQRAPLLSHTLAELRKDLDCLRRSGEDDDAQAGR